MKDARTELTVDRGCKTKDRTVEYFRLGIVLSPGVVSTRAYFRRVAISVRGCIAYHPRERVTLVIIMIFRHGVVLIPSG